MIVDIKVHSKPQAILRRLINGQYVLSKNSRIIKVVNNSNYNPIDIA